MQITSEFQDNVRKWVLIDNKIKAAQEAIKLLNKEKQKTGTIIMDYMKNNKLADEPINITGGKLAVSVSNRVVPMNKEYIIKRLTEYFHNENKAKELAEFLYADRENVAVETLKRTNAKKKKV